LEVSKVFLICLPKYYDVVNKDTAYLQDVISQAILNESLISSWCIGKTGSLERRMVPSGCVLTSENLTNRVRKTAMPFHVLKNYWIVVKNQLEVSKMFLICLPKYYDVVNKDTAYLQVVISQAILHESLISSWCIGIVRKKNGTIRMCVDYRQLNKQSKKDSYALPRIEELWIVVQAANYFQC
jgi:hypothetical protein